MFQRLYRTKGTIHARDQDVGLCTLSLEILRLFRLCSGLKWNDACSTHVFFRFGCVFDMVSIRIPAEGLQICLHCLKIENQILVLHVWVFLLNHDLNFRCLKCHTFMNMFFECTRTWKMKQMFSGCISPSTRWLSPTRSGMMYIYTYVCKHMCMYACIIYTYIGVNPFKFLQNHLDRFQPPLGQVIWHFEHTHVLQICVVDMPGWRMAILTSFELLECFMKWFDFSRSRWRSACQISHRINYYDIMISWYHMRKKTHAYAICKYLCTTIMTT